MRDQAQRAAFRIDKAYAWELKRKVETFQRVTQTPKHLQLVLITLSGFKPNIWSEGLVDAPPGRG